MSNLFDNIKKNKKLTYIIVALLMLFCFFILTLNFENQNDVSENSDISLYTKNLEVTLSDLLSSIDGAGKVKVAISIKSGMETVLAMKTTVTDTISGKETVTTPILLNGKTVVVKEVFPEISGILIVAEGADRIIVKNKLLQATSSFLDVNVNKIEILSMG